MRTDFVTIMDLEMTTWPHAHQLGWPDPTRPPEVVQIGAIKIDANTLEQKGKSFACRVRPVINPKLSAYFIRLTDIGQHDLRYARTLRQTVADLQSFAEGSLIVSYGSDLRVLKYDLHTKSLSRIFCRLKGGSIRPWIQDKFPDRRLPSSGALAKEFGLNMPAGREHDAVYDCISIARTVRHCVHDLGFENPFSNKRLFSRPLHNESFYMAG